MNTPSRVAVIDESTPQSGGGVIYALGAVVMGASELARLTTDLPAVLNNRKTPFHWERDKGPVIRERVVETMLSSSIHVCVAAALCAPTAQASTRAMLLSDYVLPLVARLGVDALIIESRSNAENKRDRNDVRDWCRESLVPSRPWLDVEFADKSVPITWLADAASGMWSDTIRCSTMYLDRLAGRDRLRQATWLS